MSTSAGVFVSLPANGVERWRRKQLLNPQPQYLWGQEGGSANQAFSASATSTPSIPGLGGVVYFPESRESLRLMLTT